MIQWHEFGGSMQSHCGRFEIDEWQPGMWIPEDNATGESGPATDLHMAQEWCESRLLIPLENGVLPDIVLVEGVDGVAQRIPKDEAPAF